MDCFSTSPYILDKVALVLFQDGLVTFCINFHIIHIFRLRLFVKPAPNGAEEYTLCYI